MSSRIIANDILEELLNTYDISAETILDYAIGNYLSGHMALDLMESFNKDEMGIDDEE